VGKAYTPEEKAQLLDRAKSSRSPAIYPALMLALHAGLRDAELRELQWGRVDLSKAFLTVGDSKSEAGEGRTVPLNSELLQDSSPQNLRIGLADLPLRVRPGGQAVSDQHSAVSFSSQPARLVSIGVRCGSE
jgi:integrase